MIHSFSKRSRFGLTFIAFVKFFLLIIIALSAKSYGQTNINLRELTNLILTNDPGLNNFWLPEELARSERLGIRYRNTVNKFMIGYAIDEKIPDLIKHHRTKHEWNRSVLRDGYSLLTLRATADTYKKDFYLKDSHLVSPVYYHSRGWKKAESEFFFFFVSDPKRFNAYSIRQLDSFVLQTCALLNMSDTIVSHLRTNKIYYYLCRDEEEIERLTGFRTRGIYLLAFDYIVTTYNCHFHELAHLLMNYKLRSLPLYANPFFQEGFAVATGGRGGLGAQVMLDCGQFFISSGITPVDEIFLPDGFYQVDASVSYPVSGLYNQFLMSEWGIEKYLKIYLEQSYDNGVLIGRKTDSIRLPSNQSWHKYLQDYGADPVIQIERAPANAGRIINESFLEIREKDNRYYFKMKDTILITASEHFAQYSSNVFSSLFPSGQYRSEKYLIAINSEEIALYNLFTDIRTADYIVSMKTAPDELRGDDGYYYFSVKKELFDESLSGCTFKII